ncbi:MAG: mechanosensitive ion channel domain-containing protein [Pseudomonadota bacterium]
MGIDLHLLLASIRSSLDGMASGASQHIGHAASASVTHIDGPPLPAAGVSEGDLFTLFNPDAVPYALAILVVTYVLVQLLYRGSDRLAERMVHRRLLIKNARTIIGFVAYAVAAVLAASAVFTVSSQVLFALSGTLAVAAGFALKDLASSFLAGLSILTNKPFQVGDRISFGGFYGEVIEIGLRNVQLVTLDDNLVTIPTNKFLNDPVASANAGALDCMVVIPFYLEPDADHRRARQIVNDAVLASKYLYLGKPFGVLFALDLTPQGRAVLVVTAKAYVYDTRHEKAFLSDVTDRAITAFRGEGIRLLGEGQTQGPPATL